MEAQFLGILNGKDQRFFAQVARPVLAAAAAPYRLAVTTRNWLFDVGWFRARRMSIPVVSIGNLTLGGTGKTPFVEFVCRWFLARGKRPVILSRGYRAAGLHNDEALLLQANLPDVPHLQGKDRVALARQAIEQVRPDVLVLDDGFQHRCLARDLDVVLIDCTEPFGYGRLFPRGLLREPIANVRRAGLIVLSRANQVADAEREQIRERINAVAGDKPIVSTDHVPSSLRSGGAPLPLHDLAGRSVAAFCGIGNPQAFWKTLADLECRLVGTRAFRDHHHYSAADVAELAAWSTELRPDFVITTQKDAVKLPPTLPNGRPVFALQIAVAITDPDRYLERALIGLFGDLPPSVRAA
jgi:tetraacyldisaccharide 4'-kinase